MVIPFSIYHALQAGKRPLSAKLQQFTGNYLINRQRKQRFQLPVRRHKIEMLAAVVVRNGNILQGF